MITVEKFLACVRENAARVTHYESGGDGSKNGACDCIGLIIGALRLAGVGWEGTHGSNWAARNALQEAGPSTIRSVSDLEAGMVVFKGRRPEDQNYKLPDHYQNSGDLTDYYHVGVVMSTNPLQIDHCTKIEAKGISGMVSDTALGQWKYYGHMKSVEFGLVMYHNGQLREKELPWRVKTGAADAQNAEEVPFPEKPLYTARVTAKTGSTVNMRKGPDGRYGIIKQIPLGTRVPVYDCSMDGWCRISFAGSMGYTLSEFLLPLDLRGQETENDEKQVQIKETVTLLREKALKMRGDLSGALLLLDRAIQEARAQ